MSFNSVVHTNTKQSVTHEGGRGFAMNAKEELYILVAGSLMSGDSFYEKQDDRMARFRALVAKVAQENNGPEFIAALTKYAREQLYLRTTPAMLAGEAFLLHLSTADKAGEYAWKRGDDHLETLAYVKATGAKTIPKGLLDEVAKRLNKLTEYEAVKYARSTRSFSQADAIRLSHPKPKDDKQSALFRYLSRGWDQLSAEQKALLPEVAKLKDGGESLTWEQHISKNGSTPESWEKAFELMGYMALLRNLRNLTNKGATDAVLKRAAQIIGDPKRVAKSKQLPFRFISAWRNLPSSAPRELKEALVRALDLSAGNLPELSGRTLVLIDTSGSMQQPVSGKSDILCSDTAATLGAIFASKIDGVVWAFATTAKEVSIAPNTPVIEGTDKILAVGRNLGGGTNMGSALNEALRSSKRPFDRIIILSDMQAMDDVYDPLQRYRKQHPETAFYAINLAGYHVTVAPRDRRTIQLAGFSDRVLSWVKEMEQSSPVKAILDYEAVTTAVELGSLDETTETV